MPGRGDKVLWKPVPDRGEEVPVPGRGEELLDEPRGEEVLDEPVPGRGERSSIKYRYPEPAN